MKYSSDHILLRHINTCSLSYNVNKWIQLASSFSAVLKREFSASLQQDDNKQVLGHTHTYTRTHKHTHTQTKKILNYAPIQRFPSLNTIPAQWLWISTDAKYTKYLMLMLN